jgi:hypothetical protein
MFAYQLTTKQHTMKKARKIELEILAIELWFQNFGVAGFSSDADRVYMSTKLNKLKNELNNIKTK